MAGRTAKATSGRRGADSCRPLRDLLKDNFDQIVQTHLDLSDPDIPTSIKKRLRMILVQLETARRRLLNELAKCVARDKKARSARRSGRKPDPCQPLRDQLDRLDKEIAKVEDSLSDHDIPESIKGPLRALLRRMLQLRTRLLALLRACEAKHGK